MKPERGKTPGQSRIGELVDVETADFHGSVHVRTDGAEDGPALVLIHGFSGSLRWYDQVVASLEDTFRIVRIDLAGHAFTGGAALDAPSQGALIGAVLDHLEIRDATAIGHSFGADVAVELAERSSRITRLVVVAQAPDYSDANLPRGRVVMTLPVVGHVLHRTAYRAGVVVHLLFRATRRNHGGTELVTQALQDFGSLNSAMFRTVLVVRRDRMAARPLDVQVLAAGKPTMVVLGDRDHFYGARSAARYRTAGADVHVLADCGHSPAVEMPERTASLIRAFVGSGSAHELAGPA